MKKKIKKIPPVKSVMTPFPYWIDLNSPIKDAERMMAEHHIHHLPVKENGTVVGMIADRDLRLTLNPTIGAGGGNKKVTIKDICTFHPYIVDLKEPLDEVTEHMAKNRVGTALVLRNGRLAGIFSSLDACRFLSQFLKDQFADPEDKLIA
ncbi:MAG: CBS domain-containing protein [Nitrospinota bacterium]